MGQLALGCAEEVETEGVLCCGGVAEGVEHGTPLVLHTVVVPVLHRQGEGAVSSDGNGICQHGGIPLVGPVKVQPQIALVPAAQDDAAPDLPQSGNPVLREPPLRRSGDPFLQQDADGVSVVGGALRLHAEDHRLPRVGVQKRQGVGYQVVKGQGIGPHRRPGATGAEGVDDLQTVACLVQGHPHIQVPVAVLQLPGDGGVLVLEEVVGKDEAGAAVVGAGDVDKAQRPLVVQGGHPVAQRRVRSGGLPAGIEDAGGIQAGCQQDGQGDQP